MPIYMLILLFSLHHGLKKQQQKEGKYNEKNTRQTKIENGLVLSVYGFWLPVVILGTRASNIFLIYLVAISNA